MNNAVFRVFISEQGGEGLKNQKYFMPSAICNTCGSLVHYHQGLIKKQASSCGSKDMKSVAGTYDPQGDSWVYTDRKGYIVKNVPRLTQTTIQQYGK